VEDISLMRVIPGMVIIVPADAVETEKVVEEIVKYNGPVYVRLSRSKSPVIFDKTYSFKIGKGSVLKDGKDITIFATGLMVANALDASVILEKEGVRPRVVNISTIKPLDEDLVEGTLGGDENAFSQLYERYRQPVYATAYRIIQSAEDARDATQEVFVKLYRSLRSWNPRKASFSTWIYRLASNHAIDCWRARNRK
jgi:deoxyxylulose-5-phosphate synthase